MTPGDGHNATALDPVDEAATDHAAGSGLEALLHNAPDLAAHRVDIHALDPLKIADDGMVRGGVAGLFHRR
jgi:hypothetical protein